MDTAAPVNPSPAPTASPNMDAAVVGLVAYFEQISLHSLAQLGDFYAANARFVDPFNDVVGVSAIQGIFAHMFASLHKPRFVVTTQVVQGQQCFLTWEFRFAFKTYRPGVEQVILGASHLVLDATGRVTLHRDYWDAAQELYEKLPLVGSVMRWLKKRVSS